MTNNKSNEMANRISQMPNDKLIEMVTTGAKDYTVEAVNIAKLEINKRGGMEEIKKNSNITDININESEPTIEQIADNALKESKKIHFLHFLLWWKISKDEIDAQIEGYDALKLLSARGISLLFILFGALISIILTVFINNDNSNHIDYLVFSLLLLGYFVYKGHQWAILLLMIIWSLDKFILTYNGLVDITHSTTPGGPFVHLIWWAIFMHPFYLAFKVEQIRRKYKRAHI